MKKTFLIFSLLSLVSSSYSQDIEFARKVVDTLCSPGMYGRGYAKHGDSIAAEYLAGEIRSCGIKPFNDNYFQKFNISVNTFPENVKVSIDGKQMQAGKDYLILPLASSCKGSFDLIWVTEKNLASAKKIKKFFKKDLTTSFVVLDKELITNRVQEEVYPVFFEYFKGKGVILLEEKDTLQHNIQGPGQTIPIILMKKDMVSAGSKKIDADIYAESNKHYTTRNVAGYLEGKTDSFIVFTAHYDHLGILGPDVQFPGADDNASGCAYLLNLAKHYSEQEEKPHYSIGFIFFTAEEMGLKGSKYYVRHPLFPLSKIRFLINLDIVGAGEKGIMVVNGTEFKEEYTLLDSLAKKKGYFDAVKRRGPAAFSDHHPFYEKGVRAVFIYTEGKPGGHHHIYDTPENLSLYEYNDLFKLLLDFVENVR